MPFDAYKNFAAATLAAGINSSATSLSVASGQGARFPAAPFNATIYNATDYADATDAYHAGHAVIARVTNIAGDVFTISQGQEGTTPVNLNTAGKTYRIIAGLTTKFIDEIKTHPVGGFDPSRSWRMRQDFTRIFGYQSNGAGFEYNIISSSYGFGGLNFTPPTNEAKIRPFSGWGESDFSFSNVTGQAILGHGTRIKTPTTLGDATNNYDLVFGFFGGGAWLPSQYMILMYNYNLNGGKWLARSKLSSETTQDTGVTVAANSWYDLRVEGSSTSAKFFIDDVEVASITTNIPTASMGPQYQHYKQAGANRTSHLKFMELFYTP